MRGKTQIDRSGAEKKEPELDLDDLGDVTKPWRLHSAKIWSNVERVRVILRGPLILALLVWSGTLLYLGFEWLENGYRVFPCLMALSSLTAMFPYLVPTNRFAIVASRMVIVFHSLVIAAIGILVETVGKTIISRGGSNSSDLGPFAMQGIYLAVGMALLGFSASTRGVKQKMTES
ncbi:MAG: hypothetical protein IPO40_17465 [Fibrobacteres bacterium]|nr:hypothetical protein [Fibrobacterota bacterium]